DAQGLLFGDGMTAMVQRIAEDRRDAAVVLAAGLEIMRDVLREGGILLAQEVANVVEPEHHRGQVLRQARRDAARAAYEALVHAALERQIIYRAGRQVRAAHRPARARRRERQKIAMSRLVLQVVDRGHAAGAAGQRRMGGDVLHALAHEPQAPPVPQALEIFLSATHGHGGTSSKRYAAGIGGCPASVVRRTSRTSW